MILHQFHHQKLMTEGGSLLAKDQNVIWPYVVIAITAGVYLVLAYLIPPGADTLWRLHIARGILDGQVLYRDFIEVNPPLWFWGALPAAALGGYPALVIINLVATFVTLALMARLCALSIGPIGARGAVVALAIAVLGLSVGEIGQREQAFLVACVLWCALISARIERQPIPVWLGVAATCLCAYGFALKHYFVVVPVVCELILLIYLKRAWRPIRLETIVLAALAICYGVAVVTLTPDFLGRVLGLVQASYDGFGPGSLVGPKELERRIIKLTAFVAAPILAILVTRDKRPLLRLLVVTALMSVAIIMVQEKYWRYHMISANGLALMVVAMVWHSVIVTPAKTGWNWAMVAILPIALGGLLWLGAVQPAIANLRSHGQPIVATLETLVGEEPRDHHIVILSTAPDNAFYPLARAGRPHWSRHYSMWMMPGLYAIGPQDLNKVKVIERARVLDEFTADIMCTPPDLIIGEVGLLRNAARTRFDAMAFLREDRGFGTWVDANYIRQPDFAFAAWAQANNLSQANVGRYPIWRLKGAKPASSRCPNPH
jgi:hypothetical protein